MAEVQTPVAASSKDTALLTVGILVILGGIVAFYWYDEMMLPLRIGMFVAGLALGAALAWFTWYGREFWEFSKAARVELRKVVWPGRDETVQTTIVVFIFATVMGLFFWALDWGLTYMTRFLGGGQSG